MVSTEYVLHLQHGREILHEGIPSQCLSAPLMLFQDMLIMAFYLPSMPGDPLVKRMPG